MDSPDIVFKYLAKEDVEKAHKLEVEGYHPDEAASLEALNYRFQQAGDLFLGAYDKNTKCLVGFVVSTLSKAPLLPEESMSKHDPDGDNICIHSVCVSKDLRRRGVALSMLKRYVEDMKARNKELQAKGRPPAYSRLTLISRTYLGDLYSSAGFKYVGVSPVVHGPDPWLDYKLELQ
ncbi:hypothetical protein H4219_004988 [Mycoemilia scoparia]|uniref:N-acetyltransferase domain-containing protein n=1 Tax=Mycoemilia scoparia TaxID=417184 RepID=A0A9W8DQX0_9FUNG|nr:hypothetical protein H4219_004988 [Mycoemilia scoparia]